ncbi:hypothetical protein niasHT_038722 [Heterodera trifolii]|uniref:Uncharacterized protein n=1 Tax=Heterodera trifolii TaxID=157864 RepID=A0ABD2I433_9BILA
MSSPNPVNAPMEIDPPLNPPTSPILASQSPTFISSLPPKCNPEGDAPDHENESVGTVYSSFPNSAPTTPQSLETQFVVTIDEQTVTNLPIQPPMEPRPRVLCPTADTSRQQKIEVVTGISNSMFGQKSNPPNSHKFARPTRRPPLMSHVRIIGHVQPLADHKRRAGWKSLAMPMERKPVPLNSIRFSSPPRSLSSPRSVALSENISINNPSPRPSPSQIPYNIHSQLTPNANSPCYPVQIPVTPNPFQLPHSITLYPFTIPQMTNHSLRPSQ